jgi:DNA-binding IclR family transcriptional regulator
LPNYGENEQPRDLVPDWFLGGNRRRRLLAALVSAENAVTVQAIREHVGCGRNTAFETVQALDALGMIERPQRGEVALLADQPLVKAIETMLEALAQYDATEVTRQKRSRGPT